MIRVDNLEIVYSTGTRALAPCNVAFEAGAFTVLLGASGAGKSTLLREPQPVWSSRRAGASSSTVSANCVTGAVCGRIAAAPA